MIAFELPSLGADMEWGTLLEWKVRPGDRVERGQIVAVVDTSKAAVDLEIWHSGVVAELLVQPGEKVPVGTVLATLAQEGEPARAQASTSAPSGAPAAVAPSGSATSVGAPSVGAPSVGAPSAVPAHVPATPRELSDAARHPVSPAARKRARELDVDPDSLRGTGAGGAVTIADVERAAAARAPEADTPPQRHPQPQPQPASASRDAAAARQLGMRRAIAAAMGRSKREIPHYYLAETFPMAAALDWLAKRNADLPITERILPAVLQLKAVAVALARVPELNGFFRDDRFEPADAVHAGVAISLRGGGLVAPALHDVSAKPLDALMRELADLVRRARAGSLRSSEMTDPTITVTNLGDQGVETVFGVIYPPQVALVGFGRVVERPWAHDGWVRVLPVVTATLAADHRVSDGHRGAVFLAELAELLQHPEELAKTG